MSVYIAQGVNADAVTDFITIYNVVNSKLNVFGKKKKFPTACFFNNFSVE